MDIISARKSVGRLTGEVLVNGRPRGEGFTLKTAYVPQVRGGGAAVASVVRGRCFGGGGSGRRQCDRSAIDLYSRQH
jgi:hypothetical protein